MKKYLLLLLSLTSGIHAYITHKNLYVGTIQFPLSLESVPPLRIYYMGKKINTEADHEAKRITFTLPETRARTLLCLHITPHVDFRCTTNNIKNLCQPAGVPHKSYLLELSTRPSAQKNEKGRFRKVDYYWSVTEMKGQPSSIIPDEAIIVCCDPNYVTINNGGNSVELPKITVPDDSITRAGSEEKLHEYFTCWLLAALNTDTIHEATSAIKKHKSNKTILAFN